MSKKMKVRLLAALSKLQELDNAFTQKQKCEFAKLYMAVYRARIKRG